MPTCCLVRMKLLTVHSGQQLGCHNPERYHVANQVQHSQCSLDYELSPTRPAGITNMIHVAYSNGHTLKLFSFGLRLINTFSCS